MKEEEIIDTLILVRNTKGYTQKEVSSQSGLTQQQISVMEVGDRSPTLRTLLKYCDAIGVKIKISVE